jgi:hypothetical protein
MGISSSLPTSRRGYLSEDELEQFADITVTDTDEGSDRISQAEEMIDAYVGFQQKFMNGELVAPVSSATSLTFTLYTRDQNVYEKNYFVWCEVEIISGTGAGQRRRITASTKPGVLTVASAWTVTPDSTSFYRIYQLGKFPRYCDARLFSEVGDPVYLKNVPEAVKRATASQVQYMIEMGDKFFSTDQSEKVKERIGDYEYENASGGGSGTTGVHKLLAPKARSFLNGIKNRTGRIVY